MQSKIQDAFEEGYCAGLQHEGMADAWLKSAARARELEDRIPEAPEDSDIGRTMQRLDTITVLVDQEYLPEDLKGMPIIDTRGDERDERDERDEERHREPPTDQPQQTAPIGYYDCPTCGARYRGENRPTVEELIGGLQSSICGNPGCRTAQPADPEWQVECWWNVTAATPHEAARQVQAMLLDPKTTETWFTVRPWRNGEVQEDEDYHVNLALETEALLDAQSDVPPTLPDDADWVPGQ